MRHGAVLLLLVATLASAHDEVDAGGVPPDPLLGPEQFESHRAHLHAWVGLTEFPATLPTRGNDIWGYASPSGREYAFVGMDTATGVVDVTDPDAPVVVAELPHNVSTWSDTRTFADYAYTSNQATGGIQVFDIAQIDAGIVTELAPITGLGLDDAHTIALDPVSGWLYTAGSAGFNGGIVAIDLANPAVPVVTGTWTGNYIHALQVVTHESGPYAGLEIAYSSGGDNGFQIHDVTDKNNITLLATLVYPGHGYTHQGWLDWDNQLFYLNDEGDEKQGNVESTTTYVFDVSDIYNPVLASTFTNGSAAIDHNLAFKDGFVYEANYTSGLRIYDARLDPLAPVEVGWVDTYPLSDATSFNGAWGVYADLPSGNILVGDINGGLFVIDPTDAVTLPPDIAILAAPAEGAFLLPGAGGLSWEPAYAATSVTLTVSADPTLANPAVALELDPTETSVLLADLGLADCATWYWGITAHNVNGDTASDVRSFTISVAGDIVLDGTVNAADSRRFKKASAAGHPMADLDGNGVVDAADRNILIANFGAVCP